jgi:isocitrate dehydrogenase (NAD+)
MLKYINQREVAEKIEKALFKTIKEGTTLTCDLGGSSTTTEFTNAIIKNLP